MQITFCKDRMVRIRYATKDMAFLSDDSKTGMISKFTYDPVDIDINDQGNDLRIASDGLVLRVDKSTLAIHYYNADESQLLTCNTEDGGMSGSVSGPKSVRFERDAGGTEEHFFGLGSSGEGADFSTIDWRGQNFQLFLSDKNKHAITPLFYSTAGYGIFLNSAYNGNMDFRTDPYELRVEGGEIDYYFFYGPSFKDILSDFTELSGRMNMPPKYALGLTVRGKIDWDESQLIDAVERLQDAGVPLDTVGVEPGWQSATYPCTYVWSNKFPDPKGFIDKIHALGVKVNLWEQAYVHAQSPIYEAIKPYSLDGSQYQVPTHPGTSYGFGGLIPDFTIEKVRKIYWEIFKKNLADIGVDGYKTDETDEFSAPADTTVILPGGLTASEYHNLLGTLAVNLVHEGYKNDLNKRTYIFSRGNYAGMQKYATTAYTDYFGFEQFVRTVVTQGFTGTYFTPELRSVSEPNNVMYQRRTQLMMLTPFPMSNEWVDGQLPLDRPAETLTNYIDYANLHYSLISYMYSYFWESHKSGIGVIRPVMMEYQDDPNTYGIDDQFFLGSEIMVAPVYSARKVAQRKIYLPQGVEWVDYANGYVYAGGQTIDYQAPADLLPIFIRSGSILPLNGKMKNTEDMSDPDITLDIYPSKKQAATFTLFEDDGISYDYEKGAYCETKFGAALEAGKLMVSIGERTSPADAMLHYAPAERDFFVKVHYRAKPTAVTLDGALLTEFASAELLDSAHAGWCYMAGRKDSEQYLYVKFHDDGQAHVISADVPDEPSQGALPPVPEIPARDTYACVAPNVEKVGVGIEVQSSASNQHVLNNVGNEGQNYFVINDIFVPKAGIYSVEIAYLNGDTMRKCMISVNDGAPIALNMYSTGGFDMVSSIMIDLELRQGSNHIKFYNNPGQFFCPNFDCIYVYKEMQSKKEPLRGTIYPAAGAARSGKVVLSDNDYASAGKALSGFGNGQLHAATFESVEVPTTGPYQIELTFANPENVPVPLQYTINDGSPLTLRLEQTESRNLFKTAITTVYLDKGLNRIGFFIDKTKDGAFAVELDQLIVAADERDERTEQSADMQA